MSTYIRMRRPGGTFFFTVALADRRSRLLVERIDDLRAAYGAVAAARPFRTEAIVVMPDHLHAVWTLPEGDSDYSTRWKKIKTRFSKEVLNGGLAPTLRVSASKRAKGKVGIWQRRFWEHTVRDEADFAACVRYCHFNPVKHGFVERAEDWPYSSVHREIREGRWEFA
ncbi:MAG: transposase [Maritimibacter sp.]|nr:transposase [Maritimibacter sp.]